jgi:hypothetical protein
MTNDLQSAHRELSITSSDLKSARQTAAWAVDLLTDSRQARASELCGLIDEAISFADRLRTVILGDLRCEGGL